MEMTPQSSTNPTKVPYQSGNLMHMFDGIHFQFPEFKHDHPKVIDVNKVADAELTIGQKVADKVAESIGSWRFIIAQSIILTLWILLNSLAFTFHWDNYPYVLCNLALSFEAAFSAPFIMMSQNRQAEKDRLTAQNDYLTDCKGEEETRNIMLHLDHQDEVILQVIKRLEEQHAEMLQHIARLDPTMAKKLGADVQLMAMEDEE